MSAANKQIYIPELRITGSYVEEVGTDTDKIIYPGKSFDVTLTAEDFTNAEDYHTIWLALSKAVKNKLSNNGT